MAGGRRLHKSLVTWKTASPKMISQAGAWMERGREDKDEKSLRKWKHKHISLDKICNINLSFSPTHARKYLQSHDESGAYGIKVNLTCAACSRNILYKLRQSVSFALPFRNSFSSFLSRFSRLPMHECIMFASINRETCTKPHKPSCQKIYAKSFSLALYHASIHG
jgi:hypothetical protein